MTMRTVTPTQLDSNIRKGRWELDYEPGRNGFAQVRDCITDKVMTVRVTLH
jgi:hypothetical protein